MESKKKIVLVGNDTPLCNYSHFIDSCDFVVRFNFSTQFSTGLVGSKTSALALCTSGGKGRSMIGSKAAFIHRPPTMWIAADHRTCQMEWMSVTQTPPLNPTIIANSEEFWFLGEFGDLFKKVYRLQDRVIKDRVDYNFEKIKRKLGSAPTTGFIVIEYVLEHFKDYEKFVVCFGYGQLLAQGNLLAQGGNFKQKLQTSCYHNFDKERLLVQQYINEGKIKNKEIRML